MATPFYRRWAISFARRLARRTWTGGFKVVRRHDALFLLNYRNYVDRRLAFEGGYERAQLAFLTDGLRRRGCDTFVDIGANFGLYSILMAKEPGCEQVIAFEPDPRNYDQLRANLYLNGLSGRVIAHRLAVGRENGPLPFFFAADSTTGESRAAATAEGGLVDAVRLADFLPVTGRRLCLKIDVENHEREAVAGMTRILRENRCLIQVECFTPNLRQLTHMLAGLGYRHIHGIGDDQYFAND
jgi:FkbM family methyltransferase